MNAHSLIAITLSMFSCLDMLADSLKTPSSYFKVPNVKGYQSYVYLEVELDMKINHTMAVFRSITHGYTDNGNSPSNGKSFQKVKWEVTTDFAAGKDVFLSGSGDNMVIVRPPNTMLPKGTNLSDWDLLYFYANGKLIKTIKLSKFLDVSSLQEYGSRSFDYREFGFEQWKYRGLVGGSELISSFEFNEKESIKNEVDYFYIKIRDILYFMNVQDFKIEAYPMKS
jgi:hypothetical protein